MTGTNNSANYQTTQYNVITGNSNNQINNVAPSATSGVPLVSNGSSSQPSFTTAVVAGGGTGSTSFTAYGPVVAASSTTGALTSVSPSATSGVPFISQGSSSNPAFGTAVVGGGGTGATSFTAYSVICAGTTSTGNFQNVSGLGSSGQVLTSNGASALPTWQASSSSGFTSVVMQVFSANGTYTPTTNMKYCIIECIGAGGGGGGAATTAAGTVNAGGGGGAGEYSRIVASAATVGASQTVTIGAVGTGGTAGNNAGQTGGDTSVGTICIAKGGGGGGGAASNSSGSAGTGGSGGTGTFKISGASGYTGFRNSNNPFYFPPSGAQSVWGQGGNFLAIGNGTAGYGYGSGGGGGADNNSGSNRSGGNGAPGYVVITEFI